MNVAHVYKCLALPTWVLIQILISNMPYHPYSKEYPTLLAWALHSRPILRFFDIALWLLCLALVARTYDFFF